MTLGKRLFDLTFSLLMLPILLPVIAALAGIQLLTEGRPIFYRAERMKSPTRSFTMLKFRSMTEVDGEAGVSGGDKAQRVTRLGWFLRRSRFDELPQIFNVLAGDMSLVGPRPQTRNFVERFHNLYDDILSVPPGVTGLDSITIYRYEGRLLSRCTTPAETDRAYTTRCLPLRHRLNLIYIANRTACLDLWIIWRTGGIMVHEIMTRRRNNETDRLG